VAGLGIKRWRQRAVELAPCLGRWPKAVGHWAQTAGQLRVRDERFLKEYETLDEQLSTDLGE